MSKSVCRNLFKQMKYFLNFRQVIPFAYAVMSNKSSQAYEGIFNLIQKELFEMKPASFMMDFEAGMRKAVDKCFPAAQIYGCWYHFCAAVRRKMTNFKMRKFLKNNKEALAIYLKLLRLPLLPREFIVEGFNIIKKESQEKGVFLKLRKFFSYFERYWMKMVGIGFCSVFFLCVVLQWQLIGITNSITIS